MGGVVWAGPGIAKRLKRSKLAVSAVPGIQQIFVNWTFEGSFNPGWKWGSLWWGWAETTVWASVHT